MSYRQLTKEEREAQVRALNPTDEDVKRDEAERLAKIRARMGMVPLARQPATPIVDGVVPAVVRTTAIVKAPVDEWIKGMVAFRYTGDPVIVKDPPDLIGRIVSREVVVVVTPEVKVKLLNFAAEGSPTHSRICDFILLQSFQQMDQPLGTLSFYYNPVSKKFYTWNPQLVIWEATTDFWCRAWDDAMVFFAQQEQVLAQRAAYLKTKQEEKINQVQKAMGRTKGVDGAVKAIFNKYDRKIKAVYREIKGLSSTLVKLGTHTFRVAVWKELERRTARDFSSFNNINGVIPMNDGRNYSTRYEPLGVVPRLTHYTATINASYDPSITAIKPTDGSSAAHWLAWRFVSRMNCEDDADTLYFLHLFGNAISGDRRWQAFILLIGEASNAKSTWAKVLAALLGSYFCPTPAGFLFDRGGRPAGNSHSAHVTALKGKLFTMCTEMMPCLGFQIDNIKALSGGDTFSAREVFQAGEDTQSLELFTHAAAAGNPGQIPPLPPRDEGFNRRLRYVHLDAWFHLPGEEDRCPWKEAPRARYPIDPELEEKLVHPAVLNAIFTMLMLAAAMNIPTPARYSNAQAELLDSGFRYAEFIADNIEVVEGFNTQSSALFARYQECGGKDRITVFHSHMKQRFTRYKSGTFKYRNIRLKDRAISVADITAQI